MQAGRMTSLLDRLAEIGAQPDDTSEDRLRAGALILASIGIAAISCFWIGVYLAYGYETSAAIPFVYQIVTLVGLYALSRTKRFDIFRTTQLAAWLILPALLQITLGGFVASSGMILWAVLVPFAAVALLGVRRAVPWLMGSSRACRARLPEPAARTPPAWLPAVAGGRVHRAQHLRARAGRVRAARLLRRPERAGPAGARRRAGALGDAAAQHVADGHRPPAEAGRGHDRAEPRPGHGPVRRHRGVHAASARRCRRSTLVQLLDRIFSALRRARRLEGLEKIKTIGDAYMVVGGAPEPRIDHAEAIARLALAMRERARADRGRRGLRLQIRIGIDTGPAVAGVIGTRKFIYDLWGDTVNTASRMESHGVPGEIQLTERAAAALDGAFELGAARSDRGQGQGLVETFFLLGKRQPEFAPPDASSASAVVPAGADVDDPVHRVGQRPRRNV